MESKNNWMTPTFKQIWTSIGVLVNILGQGITTGYPSCLLHALAAPDSPIKTDINSSSWIASVTGISCMVGCITSSLLMDWCGRRKAYIIGVIPSVLGWLLIYIAFEVPTLIVGRILDGLSGGSTAFLGIIVLGEYTNPKIRGVLLILKTTVLNFGSLLVHLMGHYLHWRSIALVALSVQLINLAMVYTWRESPAWLASKNRFEKCEREFYWLRGDSEEAVREYEEFIEAQKERQSMSVEKASYCETTWNFIKKFSRKDFLKPLFVTFVGCMLIEASGRHIFPAYARQIVGYLSSDETDAFYINLCFDLIICISTTVSSILSKYINRRMLLFSSGVPAVIVLFSFCSYMFLVSNGIIANISWIPTVGFLMLFILSNLGCTVIPFVLIGEIFPLVHKGAGTMVVGVIWSICLMVGVKVTPYLLVSLKLEGTFTVFGSIMGISLLILYFLQPETKDRTLQHIENVVSGRVYRNARNRGEDVVTGNIIVKHHLTLE